VGWRFSIGDNRGKLDILVVNDSTIEQARAGRRAVVTSTVRGKIEVHRHHTGSGTHTEGLGHGIAVADYDNDGLPDIYITGYNEMCFTTILRLQV